jgi:hypothetical protein
MGTIRLTTTMDLPRPRQRSNLLITVRCADAISPVHGMMVGKVAYKNKSRHSLYTWQVLRSQ